MKIIICDMRMNNRVVFTIALNKNKLVVCYKCMSLENAYHSIISINIKVGKTSSLIFTDSNRYLLHILFKVLIQSLCRYTSLRDTCCYIFLSVKIKNFDMQNITYPDRVFIIKIILSIKIFIFERFILQIKRFKFYELIIIAINLWLNNKIILFAFINRNIRSSKLMWMNLINNHWNIIVSNKVRLVCRFTLIDDSGSTLDIFDVLICIEYELVLMPIIYIYYYLSHMKRNINNNLDMQSDTNCGCEDILTFDVRVYNFDRILHSEIIELCDLIVTADCMCVVCKDVFPIPTNKFIRFNKIIRYNCICIDVKLNRINKIIQVLIWIVKVQVITLLRDIHCRYDYLIDAIEKLDMQNSLNYVYEFTLTTNTKIFTFELSNLGIRLLRYMLSDIEFLVVNTMTRFNRMVPLPVNRIIKIDNNRYEKFNNFKMVVKSTRFERLISHIEIQHDILSGVMEVMILVTRIYVVMLSKMNYYNCMHVDVENILSVRIQFELFYVLGFKFKLYGGLSFLELYLLEINSIKTVGERASLFFIKSYDIKKMVVVPMDNKMALSDSVNGAVKVSVSMLVRVNVLDKIGIKKIRFVMLYNYILLVDIYDALEMIMKEFMLILLKTLYIAMSLRDMQSYYAYIIIGMGNVNYLNMEISLINEYGNRLTLETEFCTYEFRILQILSSPARKSIIPSLCRFIDENISINNKIAHYLPANKLTEVNNSLITRIIIPGMTNLKDIRLVMLHVSIDDNCETIYINKILRVLLMICIYILMSLRYVNCFYRLRKIHEILNLTVCNESITLNLRLLINDIPTCKVIVASNSLAVTTVMLCEVRFERWYNYKNMEYRLYRVIVHACLRSNTRDTFCRGNLCWLLESGKIHNYNYKILMNNLLIVGIILYMTGLIYNNVSIFLVLLGYGLELCYTRIDNNMNFSLLLLLTINNSEYVLLVYVRAKAILLQRLTKRIGGLLVDCIIYNNHNGPNSTDKC